MQHHVYLIIHHLISPSCTLVSTGCPGPWCLGPRVIFQYLWVDINLSVISDLSGQENMIKKQTYLSPKNLFNVRSRVVILGCASYILLFLIHVLAWVRFTRILFKIFKISLENTYFPKKNCVILRLKYIFSHFILSNI